MCVSFLPAIVSTSTRMHGEFLRLLFLQAHRETEAHFIATNSTGMSSQNINPEALRFKRAAFYNGLKSKVGLAAAKAAVCVFITAGPITKLFAGGGGGEWTTCAMIDDEPRPVWMSPLVTH